MTDAYREDLAYIHDVGFGHLAKNAAQVLLDALRQSAIDRGTVIDLGCWLWSAGYRHFGGTARYSKGARTDCLLSPRVDPEGKASSVRGRWGYR